MSGYENKTMEQLFKSFGYNRMPEKYRALLDKQR